MTAAVTIRGRPGAPLAEIPLLDAGQAAGLAALFKILASDTRLRLLHALHRGGEVRVGDLAARREGTSIYYRIADPCVPALLEAGICVAQDPHCGTA
jgi:DNA-binding transcriptional ArsR family regulator